MTIVETIVVCAVSSGFVFALRVKLQSIMGLLVRYFRVQTTHRDAKAVSYHHGSSLWYLYSHRLRSHHVVVRVDLDALSHQTYSPLQIELLVGKVNVK